MKAKQPYTRPGRQVSRGNAGHIFIRKKIQFLMGHKKIPATFPYPRNREVSMESSEKTAWLSILTNLLLVGIKTAVAFLSGSLAVTADAINSLSDVVSSVIVMIGIKISRRPARGFPYGLYKIENLVAMVTSVLILFAAD